MNPFRSLFRFFGQACNCCGQFSLILQRLAHTLRQFRENDPNIARCLQAFLIGAGVQAIARRGVQQGQRVLTIDKQTLWKYVFDTFERVQKLVLLFRFLKGAQRVGRYFCMISSKI